VFLFRSRGRPVRLSVCLSVCSSDRRRKHRPTVNACHAFETDLEAPEEGLHLGHKIGMKPEQFVYKKLRSRQHGTPFLNRRDAAETQPLRWDTSHPRKGGGYPHINTISQANDETPLLSKQQTHHTWSRRATPHHTTPHHTTPHHTTSADRDGNACRCLAPCHTRSLPPPAPPKPRPGGGPTSSASPSGGRSHLVSTPVPEQEKRCRGLRGWKATPQVPPPE